MMIYCDLDGTLCTKASRYEDAQPIHRNIDRLNQLFDAGHFVIIWTARGATTGTDWSELTKSQLYDWNVKHYRLEFRKPFYDLLIDDKSDNWTQGEQCTEATSSLK